MVDREGADMGSSKPGPIAAPPKGNCPICGAPRDGHYKPFCSRRCADVDLSRWLRGAYAIPGGDTDASDDSEQMIPLDKDTDDADA